MMGKPHATASISISFGDHSQSSDQFYESNQQLLTQRVQEDNPPVFSAVAGMQSTQTHTYTARCGHAANALSNPTN